MCSVRALSLSVRARENARAAVGHMTLATVVTLFGRPTGGARPSFGREVAGLRRVHGVERGVQIRTCSKCLNRPRACPSGVPQVRTRRQRPGQHAEQHSSLAAHMCLWVFRYRCCCPATNEAWHRGTLHFKNLGIKLLSSMFATGGLLLFHFYYPPAVM